MKGTEHALAYPAHYGKLRIMKKPSSPIPNVVLGKWHALSPLLTDLPQSYPLSNNQMGDHGSCIL